MTYTSLVRALARAVSGMSAESTKTGRKRRRKSLPRVLNSLFISAALASTSAWADYPDQPVKVVVPFAAGGATDIIARVITPRLSKSIGSQFVVLNTPGAGGMLGAASVAKTDPDGYTLLVYHLAMVTAHHMQGKKFDPINDFTPISLLAESTNVVGVTPELPVESMTELVELARKRPGELNFGSSGIGGADHLGGELIKWSTGIDVTHVPYKGGGPAAAAVAGGEVQFTTGAVSQSIGLINAGRIRPLMVMQSERSPALPNTPSAPEAGFPKLIHKTWFGIWGPAKMPADRVAKINGALKEILSTPEVVDEMRKIGIEAKWSSASDFRNLTDRQYRTWNAVLSSKQVR